MKPLDWNDCHASIAVPPLSLLPESISWNLSEKEKTPCGVQKLLERKKFFASTENMPLAQSQLKLASAHRVELAAQQHELSKFPNF